MSIKYSNGELDFRRKIEVYSPFFACDLKNSTKNHVDSYAYLLYLYAFIILMADISHL